MNNDASLLLSWIMQLITRLKDPDCNPEDEKEIKGWLRTLIMPSMPMGRSQPVTTTMLEVFGAYRQGGISGWYKTRTLARAKLEALGTRGGILLAKTGLVEKEEIILESET